MAIEHAILSDVGMRRANNQDSATIQISESRDRWLRRGHLFVVADGMGAHAAGELASKMAAEQIPHHYFRLNESSARDALRTAIQEANSEIHRRGQQNPEFHNMGTTASVLAVLPEGAIVGHVGDSRVYRFRNQVLEQLTFDHSLVWEMEAAGQLKGDIRLGNAIPKNVITRSLGPSPEVVADIEGPWPLQQDDKFLLCSDGLTGQVDDVEIGILMNCLPPDRACRVLVDLANLRGGPDNITVIIVRIGPNEIETATTTTRADVRSSWPKVSLPLAGLTAACLLAAAMFTILNSWLPAIVTGLIGVATGILTLARRSLADQSVAEPVDSTSRNSTSPYRRYPCSDGSTLMRNLLGTVHALREAAEEKKWKVNWQEVDSLQSESQQAIKNEDEKLAIRLQCDAIIATMEQLREQHRRQSGVSTLDF